MVKVPSLQTPKNIDESALIDMALAKPARTVVAESGAVTTIPAVTEKPADAEPVEAKQPAPNAAPASSRAGGVSASAQSTEELPWENVDARIKSYFQLRMPEPLKIKIEWLLSRELARLGAAPRKDRPSLHSVALDALEREIDRLVSKTLKEG